MIEVNASIQEGKYEDVLAAVQSPVITLTELIKNASDSCLNKSDPIIININTKQNSLTITDFGEGLSKYEIERLGESGYSSKMVGENTQSPINNPLSGSKGLGLLTAFFIADTLEIETYSLIDKKSYYLIWRKGEQKYSYDEVDRNYKGTTITLKNIQPKKLQMILLREEKVKLFMSSIKFFTDSESLPRIKLLINGIEESYYPSETLDKYYIKNKRGQFGFIAKASFRYENNCVTLSYEDNHLNYYTFTDEKIYLNDKSSVDSFIKAIRAPEKGGRPIKSICESDVFNEKYIPIEIPAFSGVMYIWRERKADELEQWPVGVRIYVNNYSLYKYLDKENDWLTLSEISQNVRATNYKLKNTFGYIDLTNYNENNEELKISKERNDFIDSMEQRKFIHIMRDIIVGVFSRIDMAVKSLQYPTYYLRFNSATAKVGVPYKLANAVTCSNMGLDSIGLVYDKSKLKISADWIVSADQPGSYDIQLNYNGLTKNFVIQFKNVVPEFELQKSMIVVYKGNSLNLRDYIVLSSCKDVSPDKINIFSESKNTIIKNDLFDKSNIVGQHTVLFRFDEFQRTLLITVKEVERLPGVGAKSPRIDILFPKLDQLRERSYKIPELVDAISSYYVQAPTLCMAAIRILVESSSKSFFQALYDEEVVMSFPSLVSRVMNLRDCNTKNADYIKYISNQDCSFISDFHRISDEYQTALSKDVKKNINSHLDYIDLDMFVHNPNIVATDVTVYKSMQIFSPLLNYIYDVLLAINS